MSFPELQGLGLDISQRPMGDVDRPSLVGGGPPSNKMGFLEGLTKSTLSSGTSEFVGLDPWKGVEPFRAEHPVASIASQLIGFGVPYVALGGVGGVALRAAGGAARIPGIARAAQFMADPLVASAHPIAKAAVQEMIRFAPVEASRLGLSALVGDPKRVAEQIPFNLAFTGVLGGVFRGGAAMVRGTFPRSGMTPGSGSGSLPFSRGEGVLLERLKDYPYTDPPHLKWRYLENHLKKTDLDPEVKSAIDEVMFGIGGDNPSPGLRNTILREKPVKKGWKYVNQLESNLADSRKIGPYFEYGTTKGRKVKGLFMGTNGFAKEEADVLADVMARFPKGYEGYLYTPRVVNFTDDKAANRFRDAVFGMSNVKKNVWMSREVDDGFFVVAEKIKGRAEPPIKGASKVKPLEIGDTVPMKVKGSVKITGLPDQKGHALVTWQGVGEDGIPHYRVSDVQGNAATLKGMIDNLRARHPGEDIRLSGNPVSPVTQKFFGIAPETHLGLPTTPVVGKDLSRVIPGSKRTVEDPSALGSNVIKKSLIPKGHSGKSGDTWVVYKTDQPGFFHPDLATFNAVIRKSAWGRHYEDVSEVGAVAGQVKVSGLGSKGPVITNPGFYDEKVTVKTVRPQPGGGTLEMEESKGITDTVLGKYLKTLEDAMPGDKELSIVPIDERAGFLSKALAKIHPEIAQNYGGLVNTTGNVFKRVLSPLTTQFSKSPTLLRSLHLTQAMIGKARGLALDQWAGIRETPSTPLATLGRKTKVIKPGAKEVFDKLDIEETAVLEFIQGHPELSLGWLNKQDWISKNVKDFLGRMDKIDRKNHFEMNLARALNGLDTLPYQPWHFGIARRLHLPMKVPVVVESPGVYNGVKFRRGDVLDIVDGNHPGQVVKRAQEVIDFVEETTGIKASFNRANIAGEEQIGTVGVSAPSGSLQWVLEQASKMIPDQQKMITQIKSGRGNIPGDPLRALHSARVIGRFSFLRPIPKKKMEEQIFSSILEMQAWTARNLLEYRLGYDLAHNYRRWQGMTTQAIDRISKLHGARGPVDQMQDAVADQFLAPVMGARSATRISRSLKNGMHQLTLGFFDLAHPVLNMLSMLQTIAPEVSQVLRAPSRRMAHMYEWELVPHGDKLIPVGHLSVPAAIGRGIKDLWSKDPAIMADVKWAGEQGLLGARFAEGLLNDLDEKVGYKTLSTGAETFADWIGSVLKFLPAKSEEFSRLHGFLVARRVYSDVKGLEGEQLRLMSAQFVRRTLYDYAQGSMPQYLTGPVGSFFGIFKNWQTNYLANLKGYTGEALRGNMAPLLWAGAGSATLGGLAAMPFWFTAEAASRLFANQSAMESFYDLMGYRDADDTTKLATDTMYYGAPWALLGLSLQGRSEAPGANAYRDFTQLWDSVTLQRMRYLGSAIGEMTNAWSLTGTHPGNFRKGREMLSRAVLPRTVYRGIQAVGTEGLRSLMTGNQISPAITPLEKAAFILGFTPRDVQKSNDILDIALSDGEKLKKTTQIYSDLAADYLEARDYRGFRSVVRRAKLEEGISIKSMVRGAQSRLAKRNDPSLERNVNQYMTRVLKEKLGYEGR